MKDKFIKAFMLLLFTNIFLTIIYDLLDIYVIRVIQSEILYKIISMIFVVEIKYYIEILLFVLVIENFTKIEQIKKIKFEIFDFTQFLILFSTIIGIMNFFLYNILIKDIQLTDFMNMITIYRIISIIDFINYITLSILTIFTLTFLYIVILDKKLLNEE